MEKDRTVAQTIYALVKDEFARGSEQISKSAVIDWVVEYTKSGQKKRANGDTKARQLRRLVEANYLGAIQIGGQTYIVRPNGPKLDLAPSTEEDAEETEVPEEKTYYIRFQKEGVWTVRPVLGLEQAERRAAELDGEITNR